MSKVYQLHTINDFGKINLLKSQSFHWNHYHQSVNVLLFYMESGSSLVCGCLSLVLG
jgi:hypothetical protein